MAIFLVLSSFSIYLLVKFFFIFHSINRFRRHTHIHTLNCVVTQIISRNINNSGSRHYIEPVVHSCLNITPAHSLILSLSLSLSIFIHLLHLILLVPGFFCGNVPLFKTLFTHFNLSLHCLLVGWHLHCLVFDALTPSSHSYSPFLYSFVLYFNISFSFFFFSAAHSPRSV